MSRRPSLWRMNRQYSINYIKNINFTQRNDYVQSYMKYISLATGANISEFVAWVKEKQQCLHIFAFINATSRFSTNTWELEM